MPAARSARATAKPAVIVHRDVAINLRVAGPAETAPVRPKPVVAVQGIAGNPSGALAEEVNNAISSAKLRPQHRCPK